MDTASNDSIATKSKSQPRILFGVAKDIDDAEMRGESVLNQQRKMLSFSQDALECSATSPNMFSASPKTTKKRFSVSSSSLSDSASSSPKNIRITEVGEKADRVPFQKYSKK